MRLGRLDSSTAQVTCHHSHARQTTAVIRPRESIVCVDCGGACHLITAEREDGRWEIGDIVAYRCSDCRDRWDLELTEDDDDSPPED